LTKFRVEVSETVCRALAGLDAKAVSRIKSALNELSSDPFMPRPKADIKKLHGFEKPALYRLRIGDYRAIYFVIDGAVKVTDVITRNKGYAWLD
jgi:mRNA interferase RelE/StbE